MIEINWAWIISFIISCIFGTWLLDKVLENEP